MTWWTAILASGAILAIGYVVGLALINDTRWGKK